MPPENGVGVLDLDLRGDHTGADDSCRVVKGLSRAKHGCRLELCHPVFTRSGVPRASRSKAMHLSDHPKALQGGMLRHSEVQIRNQKHGAARPSKMRITKIGADGRRWWSG